MKSDSTLKSLWCDWEDMLCAQVAILNGRNDNMAKLCGNLKRETASDCRTHRKIMKEMKFGLSLKGQDIKMGDNVLSNG